MLDFDLAKLYGVSTMALNQAVKRNIDRFPSDFMFRLSKEEAKNLSQSVIGSQKHRDPKLTPFAFTEHGVAMLSAVLKSSQAVQASIFIVRAFVKLRELLATNVEVAQKIADIEREQRTQNIHINKLWALIGKLLDEPKRPKGPMGFRS